MAITDILTRIETDAAAEAADAMAIAKAEVARIVGSAEATLAAERAAALASAAHDAGEEAATLLANARLVARDRLLAEKRELAEGVLERASEALEAMSDAEYLEFIAKGVKRAAVGGETLSIAEADAKRLGGLATRLSELGVRVDASSEPAPLPRGVLLTGDRVRVEVSPAALVADRKDELLLVAARALFGEEEAAR